MRANQLWALNFSLIDKKTGVVRSQVLGGEFNYSGLMMAASFLTAGIS
jgi:hypothetical protein